jgi:HK97 family phage portal protein
MAWNSRSNKDLGPAREKRLPIGAPIATNIGNLGRGYTDSWDIERAYREGMQKVVWVNRAVDAIAGNQTRLPIVLRREQRTDGEIVKKGHPITDLLNSQANPGENSFIFRYRLSSQILLSTRGAFIEVIRGRGGQPVALQLLPPQHTAPIPDPKKFVAGFEVLLPGAQREVLPAEDVIWIRKPHPLNPYLSLTPMEAAGIAIEIENIAKLYNRNFLLNDGRPGGLIVVNAEMNEEDKEELRDRFRGNLWRTGAVSVIASDGGAQYLDTAASPRDASYTEMRQITKEEILAAFGVPESVIGNAAGRTFSNASEELRVFWGETMLPHLEMLGRAFDVLDEKMFISFDTTEVPILILAKQEVEKHLLSEFQMGLITANEYRDGTGRKEVESELADAMLANPNLTPIGNTKKKMETPQQPGMPGMPGMPGVPGMPGAPDAGMPVAPPADGGAPPDGTLPPEGPPPESPPTPSGPPEAEPVPAEQASAQIGTFNVKQDGAIPLEDVVTPEENDDWEVKSAEANDRWEAILDRTLERFFDRQYRVIIEKARGQKARRSLAAGTLTVDHLFDREVWNRQLIEDVRPVLAGAMVESAQMVSEKTETPALPTAEFQETLDAQMNRIEQVNRTTQDEIAAIIASKQAKEDESEDDDNHHAVLLAALAALFITGLGKRRKRIAEIEAQTATNAGVFHASQQAGVPTKSWKTRKDERVRPEHRALEGKTVALNQAFKVGRAALRFPGDPLAPPGLSLGCRCRLTFGAKY